MKKFYPISLILLATIVFLGVSLPGGAPGYISHSPIRILGDKSFTQGNGVVGGSGTKEDPYIIELWEINATGYEFGIHIENTTAYFIIRNSKIYGANRGEERWKGNGIYFLNVKNGKIENCQISGNRERGIFLYNSSNNVISNNIISNNNMGIYLENSPNNVLSGNTVEMNIRYGIYLMRSFSNIVSDNVIKKDGLYGIRIYFSSNNNVSGNIIESNGRGIFLDKASNNNILNNAIEANNSEGIALWRSTSNAIFANIIEKNIEYGIESWDGSADNVIYHNDFRQNYQNARDAGANRWDNGAEGNFWDDYTGMDANGDGIGDSSYLIPGDSNEDRYPLMKPYRP